MTVHFNRHTPDDYVEEAYRKVCKIHQNLTPGHILVFVTGQKEVHYLCRKLRKRFPGSDESRGSVGEGKVESVRGREGKAPRISVEEADDWIASEDDEECEEGKEEGNESFEWLSHDSELPMKVLPLYSLLSPSQQAKVDSDIYLRKILK